MTAETDWGGAPSVLRMILGGQFEELRGRAGLTYEEAGAAIGVSRSTIRRMEAAKAARLGLADAEKLLRVYGVADRQEIDASLKSAREAGKRGWWHTYRDVMPDCSAACPSLVALTVIAIVHFVLDEDDAVGIVRRLLEPLSSGRHPAMTTGTAEFAPEEVGRVAREYAARDMPMRLRTVDEAHEFFEGLELVEPGIVQVHEWHPDGTGEQDIRDEDIAMYGATARKA